jgi:hypothetical protein
MDEETTGGASGRPWPGEADYFFTMLQNKV